MSKAFSYYLFAIWSLLSLSCESTHEWIGKKIQFPKELMLLEDKTLIPLDVSEFEKEHTSKIISIVDANCSSCILGQLNRTDSLFQTMLDQESDIFFILNVNKTDSASFRVSLQPYINARGRILWDSNFYFESLNDVFSESIFNRTFLLNSKNEIVLVGNPLFEPALIKEYRKILTKSQN